MHSVDAQESSLRDRHHVREWSTWNDPLLEGDSVPVHRLVASYNILNPDSNLVT